MAAEVVVEAAGMTGHLIGVVTGMTGVMIGMIEVVTDMTGMTEALTDTTEARTDMTGVVTESDMVGGLMTAQTDTITTVASVIVTADRQCSERVRSLQALRFNILL